LIKGALDKRAALVAEGKTPEEVIAALGEAYKYEGDKLKYFTTVLDQAGQKVAGIKRVLIVQLAENEAAPAGVVLAEGFGMQAEFFPQKQAPQRNDRDHDDRGPRGRGGKGGKGGRGGKDRDGKRGGGGGGRGPRRDPAKGVVIAAPGGEGGAPRPEGGRPPRDPRPPREARPPRDPGKPLTLPKPRDPSALAASAPTAPASESAPSTSETPSSS